MAGIISPTSITIAESVNPTGQAVATYGEGKLYQYCPLYLVELNGDYREMGSTEHWEMTLSTIFTIKWKMIMIFLKFYLPLININDMDTLENMIQEIYVPYPQYNELMMGIAETTGLGKSTYLTCSIIKEFY